MPRDYVDEYTKRLTNDPRMRDDQGRFTAAAPASRVQCEVVRVKAGYVGQIWVADEIVFETSPFQDYADAIHTVKQRVFDKKKAEYAD